MKIVNHKEYHEGIAEGNRDEGFELKDGLMKSLQGSMKSRSFIVFREDYSNRKGWIHRKWREFDDRVIKPCLIDPEELEKRKLMEEQLLLKAKLKD